MTPSSSPSSLFCGPGPVHHHSSSPLRGPSPHHYVLSEFRTLCKWLLKQVPETFWLPFYPIQLQTPLGFDPHGLCLSWNPLRLLPGIVVGSPASSDNVENTDHQ